MLVLLLISSLICTLLVPVLGSFELTGQSIKGKNFLLSLAQNIIKINKNDCFTALKLLITRRKNISDLNRNRNFEMFLLLGENKMFNLN